MIFSRIEKIRLFFHAHNENRMSFDTHPVYLRHHRAKPEWHTCLHLFRHISKKFLSVVPLQPENFCFI